MNLKERLQNLKNGGFASAEQKAEAKPEAKPEGEKPKNGGKMFQCDCGSHIRGECPQCDGNGEDTSGAFSSDIQDRLDAIGGEKAVNPPQDGDESSGDAEKPKTETEAPPDKKEEETAGLEPCPHCAKPFKHLSRHKCKLAPKTEPEPEAPPEEKPEPKETAETVGPETVINVEPTAPTPIGIEMVAEKIASRVSDSIIKFLQRPRELVEAITRESIPDPMEPVQAEPEIESGFTLLIDCIPRGDFDFDAVHAFEALIKPIGDAVAKENEAVHWSTVDYGRGPGLLSAKFERWLKETEPNGFILVDSNSAEARACLHTLRNYASSIIQGLR